MTPMRSFKRATVACACAALLSLATGAGVSAQVSTYQGFYGGSEVEEAKGVIHTSDDHYVSVGLVRNGSLNRDVLVVKTDRCGNIVWSNRFDVAQGEDIGRKVREDANGGYVIVGSTKDPVTGNEDAFLLRITSGGVFSWARRYGGTAEDDGNDLRIDPASGTIYVAGNTRSVGAGLMDGWLFQTSSTGVPMWSQTYGGVSQDMFNALDLGCNGSIVAAGYTMSHSESGRSDRDVYAVSVNMGSKVLNWAKKYGQSTQEEWGNTIVARATDLFIGGGLSDGSSIKELILDVHCTSGALVNDRLYTHPNPGANIVDAEIWELQNLPTTGLIAVGLWFNASFELHLLEVSSTTLNTIGSSVFGTSNDEAGYAVAVTGDDPLDYNLVAAGSSQNGPLGNPDLYTVVTDAVLWIPNCATDQEIKHEDPILLDQDGPRTIRPFPGSTTPAMSGRQYGQGILQCPTCVTFRELPQSPELSHYSDGTEVDVTTVAMPSRR